MNPDFRDMLFALCDQNAEFMVVGAHALAAHGLPRATGDLDIWVRPDDTNADKVWGALIAFGAPLQLFARDDFAQDGMVIQIGVPPGRIDLITSITGVAFDDAWPHRMYVSIDGRDIPVLGRADLLKNKRSTGRLKDKADVDLLEKQGE